MKFIANRNHNDWYGYQLKKNETVDIKEASLIRKARNSDWFKEIRTRKKNDKK